VIKNNFTECTSGLLKHFWFFFPFDYLNIKACRDFGTGLLEMIARVMLYEKMKPEKGKF
jgi:hypothetical protein